MSIWDTFVRDPASEVRNNATGDDACKSYENYEEDVRILKELGVTHYRFSIAWTRIQPTGTGEPNRAGLNYYHNLTDSLLANGIEPMITLYHWDLPQALEDAGGWLEYDAVGKPFLNYSKILFDEFGHKVKFWITINEPWVIALLCHGYGSKAPGIQDPNGTYVYREGHNILKAHADVYHLYDAQYRSAQSGKIGLSFNSGASDPLDPENPDDVAAVERAMQFDLGWFAHPIYKGDYPTVMKERIANKSAAQGFEKSRLPEFTQAEINHIKGTSDFFGLNFYGGGLASPGTETLDDPSFDNDKAVMGHRDPHGLDSGSSWLVVTPWYMRTILNWIREEYDNPPVLITENGMSDQNGTLQDDHRVWQIRHYVNYMLQAIDLDGCNVIGYTAWSLMDNFEWEAGYTERFGIHFINFTDPDRTRVPKDSARYYAQLIEDHGFPGASGGAIDPRFNLAVIFGIFAAIFLRQ